MNIRFAKDNEVLSGLIPVWSFGKTEEIVIACLNEELSNILMFKNHYVFVKNLLEHEIMHIILQRIMGEKVSEQYDNIADNFENY